MQVQVQRIVDIRTNIFPEQTGLIHSDNVDQCNQQNLSLDKINTWSLPD